jgi:CubicO group peptidase (beta-lactamase class C family)
LLPTTEFEIGSPRLPTNIAPANLADPYADYDAAKLVAFVSGNPLERAPGAQYDYSNVGAGLLGYASPRRVAAMKKRCASASSCRLA